MITNPQPVSANHAQCNDGTQVPESLQDAGSAAPFCADRAGLASGSPSLLCENGNYSNTVEGCKNQGSTYVTKATVAQACESNSTQDDRASCVKSNGGASGTAVGT